MEDSQLPTHTALASLLESRLMDWEKARKPQESKLLECYKDVMRIARDDDTAGSGAAKARATKALFIGSTRNKWRSASAKISDALFGAGQMPFDTEPTNEKLSQFADTFEDILVDQMERGKYKEVLSGGVDLLAMYGTGFVFGPFVRKEVLSETMPDGLGGITEQKYEFDLPYFELGNTLDVIPDAEARDIKKALGVFWVTMESPHTVGAWKSDDKYKNIDQALKGAADNGNETGSEIASSLRGNVEYWHDNNRIKVARYFGKVPKSAIDPVMGESNETASELVDVIAIMAGGVVVRVDESPYQEKCPSYRCVYESAANEIWGVGVAENNAPHQKVTNAAFRLFMEGKGMALLGTKSVDRSKFLPSEDFKKYPGKVYQFKPGLSPEERSSAIIEHTEPDVTGGWIDVIRMSEQFSDDDTGITKYTQGDDSGHLNKTASGISMIMSASSLPIKKVIQNIDSMWIEPTVEALIEWNLKYLDPETVQKIHGDEAAQVWAQIKQFGKASFMRWKATGTASFMQKEVLTNKIRAFSEFALSNPITAQLVDARELLNQTWSVMEIGKESPILKEEGETPLPPQVQQQMEQMQQEKQMLEQALQELGEKFNEMNLQLENKGQESAMKADQAQLDREAKERELMLKLEAEIELAALKEKMITERKLAEMERQHDLSRGLAIEQAQVTPVQVEVVQPMMQAMQGMMQEVRDALLVVAAPKRAVRDENGNLIVTPILN